MNGKVFLILLAMLPVSFVCPLSHATDLILNNALAQVCFSPNKGCTAAIVNAIDKARTVILVQAYSFTSTPIAKALLHAHKRGGSG